MKERDHDEASLRAAHVVHQIRAGLVKEPSDVVGQGVVYDALRSLLRSCEVVARKRANDP